MYLLIKLWALVSWSPTWMRLLPLTLSLAGVVFAVLWVRHWGSRAGWLAGLLAATSPVMVHYAQELRAYALLYACLPAGLYCGERLARAYSRGPTVGLLLCALLMSYAHYVGLLAAVALLVYVWVRGVGPRRIAMMAGVWLALSAPLLVAAVLHASHRTVVGLWVEPLTFARIAELLGSCIAVSSARFAQHVSIQLWEETGGQAWHSWLAVIMQAGVTLAVAGAMIVAVVTRGRSTRAGSGAMFAAAAAYGGLIAIVSWTAVPISLSRTVFPAFIPLIGVMALSAAGAGRPRFRTLGTVCCLTVAGIWLFLSTAPASGDVDRRPDEQGVFGAIAERFGQHDVLIVFTPEMQASAGYFLRDRARAAQIHCTEFSRLADGSDGIRLRPIPRRPNPDWFDHFGSAVDLARARHPQDHAVWLMDLGMRSAGSDDRRRVLAWLKERYVEVEQVRVGRRWSFSARRFVPTSRPDETTNDMD